MRKWYAFKALAEGDTVAEIDILDVIGTWGEEIWGDVVTAKSFLDELSNLPEAVGTIRVRVNSPGGDIFAAVAIANGLRDQRASKGRRVEMRVVGLAASAASVILQGGDVIEVADNALVMVHNPWSFAIGTAEDIRKGAEALDKVRDTIITTYQWHSELSAEQIGALMDAETWMDADEAVANGFATEKVEGLRVAACLDPRGLSALKVPERFVERVRALVRPEATPEPPPPIPEASPAAEVMAACAAAGLDLSFAQDLLAEGLPAAQVEARVAGELESRIRAESRARDIRAACAVAKQYDLAAGYITGGMTVEQVKDHLTKITAKLDKAEIDAGLDPDHGTRRRPVIDVMAVYAERNRLRH